MATVDFTAIESPALTASKQFVRSHARFALLPVVERSLAIRVGTLAEIGTLLTDGAITRAQGRLIAERRRLVNLSCIWDHEPQNSESAPANGES